jgi:tRNA G18 (ribose-2'-O)-methylase SpoU
LRSAKTYRAALVATIGHRYRHQPSDTCKTPQSVPLLNFTTVADLRTHMPEGCSLVGVELHPKAVELGRFRHPPRAIYLLGAEDHGLPKEVLQSCESVIRIDTPEPWSLNVSTAGTLVLDSRFRQMRRGSTR